MAGLKGLRKKPASTMAKNTKNKLIECTLSLYLSGGIDAVSMRKVASEAGLSTMAAYRHFKNKDDMLNHVVMEGFRRFQEYFSRAKDIPDPVASLKLCMTLYAQFAKEQPEFYEMLFMARLRSDDPELEKRCEQQIQMALLFLVDRVKACIRSGLIANTNAKACALKLWSLCHGMVSLQVLGRLHPEESFNDFYQKSINDFFVELGIE
jgi:AcrR family transcriptional regulator